MKLFLPLLAILFIGDVGLMCDMLKMESVNNLSTILVEVDIHRVSDSEPKIVMGDSYGNSDSESVIAKEIVKRFKSAGINASRKDIREKIKVDGNERISIYSVKISPTPSSQLLPELNMYLRETTLFDVANISRNGEVAWVITWQQIGISFEKKDSVISLEDQKYLILSQVDDFIEEYKKIN